MPRVKSPPLPGPDFLSDAQIGVADPPADVDTQIGVADPPGVAPAVADRPDDGTVELPQCNEPTLAGTLAQRVRERDAMREEGRQEEQDRLWARYRAGVMRETAPDANDLERFEDACAELGVSPEQVAADVAIVAEARRQLAFHAAREENAAALSAARSILLGLRRKQAAEQEAVRKALSAAEGPAALSYDAAYSLVKLARKRPGLFNVSVDPPRLREAE